MSINKLYQCIEKRRVHHSQGREAIYRILMSNKKCLSINEIAIQLEEIYPKKVSLTTIYRHLKFFVDCKLVIVIQNDLKKSYYHFIQKEPCVFSICTLCYSIEKIELNESFMKDLNNSEFITIHKKCKECKQNSKEGKE